MAIAHAGSWSIGGFRLPDFGITEALSGNKPRTASGGSNILGASTASFTPPKAQPIPKDAYYVPAPPAGSSRATSNYNLPSAASTETNQQPYDQMNQNQADANSQIDADFESAMGMLSGAESGLRGQAETAGAQIATEGANTLTELGAQKSTQEGGVTSSLSTAEKQGVSAMQQARDLFRQTQQSNNAQLSALGISSSSVSEALAERLGVETARRIAGVTGSLDEVRQNATNELGRIKNYFAEKTTQVQQEVANQKATIQNSLMQGLNQINSARSQAASAKSQARANLLSQVQQQIYSLTTQQQQFEQSLKLWAAQKSSALTPIVQDPNYLNTLVSTAQNFNKQFQTSGFGFTPEVSYDKYGNMSGKITSNKLPDEELLQNPFLQQ